MKSKIIILAFLAALFAVPAAARAQEQINSFTSDININTDGTIRVKETIVYDFDVIPHHGIYRDIPYRYSTTVQNYDVRLSNFSVADQSGNSYPFTVSTKGDDKEIKIGDPSTTITGIHTYVISYTASRVIGYFSDHDELYWNVTGNGWQVPILQSGATITLPQAAAEYAVSSSCFAGSLGSTQPCITAGKDQGDTVGHFYFDQSQTLQPAQGLTVAVAFPKGMVAKPSAWQNIWYIIQDNWIISLPLLVFIILFYLWYTRGRDPKGFNTIVAQYEPPQDLTPAEAGTIVDESADNQDVSADIIQLAVKGYLKITRTEKKVLLFNITDYQLDKLKEPTDLANPFEQRLMEGLFQGVGNTVMLSDLKNKFFQDLKAVKKDIYESVVSKGYFAKNPETVRNAYRTVGVVICVFGVYFGSHFLSLISVLSLLACGVLIIIFSFFMSKRTVKGAEAKQYILGLKLYLSVAEKDRLAFANAPEKTPERFEKLLPYAIALRVDNEWAKQFEGIYQQQPSWYYDPSGRMFSSYLLVNNLNGFVSTTNTVMASAPRGAAGGGSGFGGGGFSGGGFGGGSGGSW